jgi:hypothetical protein
MPEVDFSKVRTRRNPYAKRIANEGLVVQVGRGRPRQLWPRGSIPRSVRFSPAIWTLLERCAKAKGLTLHAALRQAILAWARRGVEVFGHRSRRACSSGFHGVLAGPKRVRESSRRLPRESGLGNHIGMLASPRGRLHL